MEEVFGVLEEGFSMGLVWSQEVTIKEETRRKLLSSVTNKQKLQRNSGQMEAMRPRTNWKWVSDGVRLTGC